MNPSRLPVQELTGLHHEKKWMTAEEHGKILAQDPKYQAMMAEKAKRRAEEIKGDADHFYKGGDQRGDQREIKGRGDQRGRGSFLQGFRQLSFPTYP
jgi:hypothetical protein